MKRLTTLAILAFASAFSLPAYAADICAADPQWGKR